MIAGFLALWSASATAVAAADPIPYDPGHVLERPLVDVAVLVTVLVSSVRGSRRSPSVAVITTTADEPHLPEIEELAESSVPRRDRP